MSDRTPSPDGRDADQLIYGGVLGLSVAAVLQLIDKMKEESWPLTLAGCAFAASLPVLAASFIAELIRTRQPRPAPPARWRQLVGLLAVVTALAGLAALFFHLGTVHGSLFLAAVGVATLLVHSL